MSLGSVNNLSYGASHSLAADAQSLGKLKMEAGKSSPEAIKETAKQFESLFMRELIKSMREASPKSGLLDNAGSDLGTDLLDQQFAVQMSGQPGGLSELIAQQLTRQSAAAMQDPAHDAAATEAARADEMGGLTPAFSTLAKAAPAMASPSAPTAASTTAPSLGITPATPSVAAPTRAAAMDAARVTRTATLSQADFVKKHSDAANKAEKASGIPASYMLGQAGHETGWGKFEIKQKGGAPSFNLFGIKAGAGWTGKTAEVTTTEYVNGVAKKQVAKFRAYDSYEDSFKDYAKLITESPRYAKAKTQTGSAYAFASGLQKAGYATDPDYALKLSRAINTTQQLRRVQV